MVRGIVKVGIGQLRLELAKEKYERSGLVGKPMPDGGRKYVKTRYGMMNCGVKHWRCVCLLSGTH